MNLTQNDRLKQVTSETLIVGVDVGSQTHFCRAFDWRGLELSRRVFKFSNTGMGFLTFLRWTEELMNKTEMKTVIVGCEPTGCYWLTFQKFLQDHDIQLVTVNPFAVNRSMELDDNSPEKSDLKDPKTIALLVKDGRYSTSYLPSGVYAEIREASVCRDQIMKQHVRLSNQIQGWLQKFFPEYFECYAAWDSTSGLMLLKEAPLPQDILRIGAGGINQIWRDAKVRGAGIKRAQTLVEAAQNSVDDHQSEDALHKTLHRRAHAAIECIKARVEPPEKAFGSLFMRGVDLLEHSRAQSRRQGQCHNHRKHHGRDDRHRELAINDASGSPEESHRDKHGRQHHRNADQCSRDLIH